MRAAILLGIFIPLAAAPGCAIQDPRPVQPVPEIAAHDPGPPPAPPEPLLVGDTLIYPVRWGRAEDLALTLESYFQGRFGPGVRIIPHIQTNQLLIHIPPRDERDIVQAPRTGPAPAAAVPGRQVR